MAYTDWRDPKAHEASRARAGSIAAGAGGYMVGPQMGYSRQEGAMSPFATTSRRRANEVHQQHQNQRAPYYQRGATSSHELRGVGATSSHELRGVGLTGSVHELHQQHLQQQQQQQHQQHQHQQQHQHFNAMQQVRSYPAERD